MNTTNTQTATPRSVATFESRPLVDHQLAQIEALKTKAAILLDEIKAIPAPNGEVLRLVALATSSLEVTVMWATKAVSRTCPSPNL